MFVSGDFWDKSPSWFLKNLKLPLFYSGNLKIFKNALRQFISNRLPMHVITSTNFIFSIVIKWKSNWHSKVLKCRMRNYVFAENLHLMKMLHDNGYLCCLGDHHSFTTYKIFWKFSTYVRVSGVRNVIKWMITSQILIS